MSTAKFNQWLNSDGTENYKCRAWVNFNGTGTVAIRASGNVSSITDNGTGDYTVNFTTAMTDVNYCANTSIGTTETNQGAVLRQSSEYSPSKAVGSMKVYTGFTYSGGYALEDQPIVQVAIFR